jgi:Peptidase family S41
MIALEDGLALAQKSVDRLLSEKNKLGLPKMQIQLLPEFLQKTRLRKLKQTDREVICDQAVLMLDQFYVHLPFKRVRYAIDPVQRLRLLRARLSQIDDDLSFHTEVLETFADMRDVHTSYRLPPPFAGAMAFLPFFLQPYFDDRHNRRFLVTSVLRGFEPSLFRAGVEVTQWNGIPVARAVDLLAEHIPGGNPAARFIRGMMRMTVRSLASTLPPDEEVVFVRYRPEEPNAEERIIELPWFAGTGMGIDIFPAQRSSVCEPLKDLTTIRKVLWHREEWKQEQDNCGFEPQMQGHLVSKIPDIFQFQNWTGACHEWLGEIDPDLLKLKDKTFGYVRIKSFDNDNHEDNEIFAEFLRILRIQQDVAPDGLILDVRGNAGGSINAAERLLQLMTPRTITPAPYQYANTSTMQSVIAKLREVTLDPSSHPNLQKQMDAAKLFFQDWFPDSDEAMFSGSLLTRGYPLTPVAMANDTGQVYYGPVVLLIDATSYSATDTFAAGFQDHEIGDIIGTDANTGGGGASRWHHNADLVGRLKGLVDMQPQLQRLPGGTSMTLAIQRSTRVGAIAGEPVEDVGVKCTIPYQLTKVDLVQNSRDLISFACRHLSRQPSCFLEVERPRRSGASLDITVNHARLDRLVFLLDGHTENAVTIKPRQSKSKSTFRIPRAGFEGTPAHELRIDGYALRSTKGKRRPTLVLAASTRVKLPRR